MIGTCFFPARRRPADAPVWCDGGSLMRQRVRCPQCHHWTDALLIWAAGDCCPSCNAPIAEFDHTIAEGDDKPLKRPAASRFSQPGLPRSRPGRLSQRP